MANENINYSTGSGTSKGLVFHYNKASDTSQTVFYIPNFRLADIQFFSKNVKLNDSKICFINYISNPGDFIYPFTSEWRKKYF